MCKCTERMQRGERGGNERARRGGGGGGYITII